MASAPSPRVPANDRTADLHVRFSQAVYGYCVRRLRSREEAEDAAQTVFLTAHRCLADGVEPRLEGPWLFKIAEHVVLHRRRTMSRRARLEHPLDIGELEHIAAKPDAEARPEMLSEALAGLPPQQQRALVLREWHGLSYREVAAELGVPQGTAETLIFRARRGLVNRRRLGWSASSWLSLKGLLTGGTLVKAVAGATTVAVVAVGTHHARPPAAARAVPHAHVVPIVEHRVVAPAARVTVSRPRVHRRTAHVAPAPVSTPVADTVPVAAPPPVVDDAVPVAAADVAEPAAEVTEAVVVADEAASVPPPSEPEPAPTQDSVESDAVPPPPPNDVDPPGLHGEPPSGLAIAAERRPPK